MAAFMGPMSAGPLVGALAHDWLAALGGLAMGIGVSLLGALLSDRLVDPLLASLQRPLQKGVPRVLVNLAAFVWAALLCALAMLAPLAVFGSGILIRIQ
jgi:hypothetical protein